MKRIITFIIFSLGTLVIQAPEKNIKERFKNIMLLTCGPMAYNAMMNRAEIERKRFKRKRQIRDRLYKKEIVAMRLQLRKPLY